MPVRRERASLSCARVAVDACASGRSTSSLERTLHSVRHVVVVAMLLAALTACGSTQDSASVTKLRWVEHADAVADAAKALSLGDHRLVGVYGYTLIVPGIDSAKQSSYVTRYGVRALEGTSDALESATHAALVNKAKEYALRYNSYILAHAQVQ